MIRCPLCHVLHNDPPDIKAGRARVCIGCHTGNTSPPPTQRRRRKPPPPTPTATSPEATQPTKGS